METSLVWIGKPMAAEWICRAIVALFRRPRRRLYSFRISRAILDAKRPGGQSNVVEGHLSSTSIGRNGRGLGPYLR